MNALVPRIEATDGVLPNPEAAASREMGALAGLKVQTDLSLCLIPLLRAMGWQGDPRHIAESLPHFTDNLDLTGFRNVLARLFYQTRAIPLRLDEIDPRLIPCLFLPGDGEAVVLLSRDAEGIHAFDGGRGIYTDIPVGSRRGTAIFCKRVDKDELPQNQSKTGWFAAVGDRFRGLAYQLLGLTLGLNVLALVTPLFVMAVYDQVVATGSMSTLAYLSIGVGIAIVFDLVLRTIRARILAYVGARLDTIVGNAIFQKILHLPPAYTERASIGAQVARIKDFESVREFFTGPMALVFLELPFVAFFIVVIGFLGGPVAFVPVIMIAGFVVLGLVLAPIVRKAISQAAKASSRRQEFVVETLFGMRAVKYTGAEPTWLERYRELAAKSIVAGLRTSHLSAIVNAVANFMMVAAGVATVVYGVFRVFEGAMTIGALVACMILVWRVLAPLQSGFISSTRLTQIRSSIGQINQLMAMRAERNPEDVITPIRRFAGRVTFSRVSLRYAPDADPALVGVSIDVPPGEVLAVVGGNGSGKSTVLKLIMGIYAPQAGNVRIDDMDIRQLDPIELRQAIAYVPQQVDLFYGTVAQNLRLANPTASDDELVWAATRAHVLDDIMALESGDGKWKRTGFEARIGDARAAKLPTSLQQGLNLARAYLKRSSIVLFDEPANGLDHAGDQAFMDAVGQMKGKATVIMVTHRPSHMRLADKIAWLDAGHLRAFGPAAEVLKNMPKDAL